MQYGSIGWSVGATLGYAQAATDKRVIACIGDGSFQVSMIIGVETIYESRILMIIYNFLLLLCLRVCQDYESLCKLEMEVILLL